MQRIESCNRPSDAVNVEWPLDDSYRPHIDLHWMNVLSDFVKRSATDCFVQRSFYVLRVGASVT